MFEYQFMINAFLAGSIIAILAAISGSFVVLKRYSLLAESLAHSALVGVAIALLTDSSPLVVALIVTVLSAWVIEYLRSFYHIYSDAILAIFLSGSLALAIIIVSLSGSFNSSLFSYLFGSILSIDMTQVWILSGAGVISLALFALFYRELYFIAFDEEVAKSSGIKVVWLNFLLVTITAVIIALSIRIVGTLLIGALMVIPVVSALRFKQSFFKTVLLALLFALGSTLAGLSISYYLSLPSGAAIVACTLIVFIISLVVNRR